MATKGKRAGGRGHSRVARAKGRLVRIVGGGTRWSRDRKDSGGGFAAERHRKEKIAGAAAKRVATSGAEQSGNPFTRMSAEAKQKRKTANAMCRARTRDRQKQRRAVAEERQTDWAKLPPVAQLNALNKRLGRGHGAEKQRKRIENRIATLAAGGA